MAVLSRELYLDTELKNIKKSYSGQGIIEKHFSELKTIKQFHLLWTSFKETVI